VRRKSSMCVNSKLDFPRTFSVSMRIMGLEGDFLAHCSFDFCRLVTCGWGVDARFEAAILLFLAPPFGFMFLFLFFPLLGLDCAKSA